MIQAAETTPDGRVQKFRIHDLLREIITSKTRDQNFFLVSDKLLERTPSKAEISVTQWPLSWHLPIFRQS
ncbi:hypothetical protein ACE6H2_016326 [Prunus campanulata]